MKGVCLVFPGTTSIVEYILKTKISKVVVDSSLLTIDGELDYYDVEIACKQFKAEIIRPICINELYTPSEDSIED